MISFDLECANGHRFEGIFKDYNSFEDQLSRNMISCPICQDIKIKRLFTGCSIQSRSSIAETPAPDNKIQNFFEILRIVRDYVKNNFDNVGRDFADKARAIYYGVEEERNIYGESTGQELKELLDEGIDVLPLPSADIKEN